MIITIVFCLIYSTIVLGFRANRFPLQSNGVRVGIERGASSVAKDSLNTPKLDNILFIKGTDKHHDFNEMKRKVIGSLVSVASLLVMDVYPAKAGIDPELLKQYSQTNTMATSITAAPEVGKQLKLEDIQKLNEAQSAILQDSADIPFIDLPSGVSYREFRPGKSIGKTVQPGNIVTVELTARCKKLATTKEVGGVMYYSTKTDSPTESLTWEIGSGTYLPGLEEAMIGMNKGAIRRIEVPSMQVFKARNADQLPLPAFSNNQGQKYFKRLFKTDATLIFEVKVLKIA